MRRTAPGNNLDRTREAGAVRRAIGQRGPDTGRAVDHLKMRSLGQGAEEMLQSVETGAVDVVGGPIFLAAEE